MDVVPSRDPVACTFCGSGEVVRYGSRRTKAGVEPRYRCNGCERRFTGRTGFLNRRSDPETIALALDLYFRGLSFRKIVDHLDQVHRVRVSVGTVYSWVVGYSRLASRWMDRLAARTGGRWQVDETFVRAGGRQQYVWNVLDSTTRFLLASHLSRVRGLRDARRTLVHAKEVTVNRPREVWTDGFQVYRHAVPVELAYREGRRMVNPHRKVRSIRAKISNNRVERLNGTQKERLKVMRGLAGGRPSQALIDGMRVHYNMVQTHGALGTTPGSAAGLPDPGGFRWKGLIAEATRPIARPRRPERGAELVFIVQRDPLPIPVEGGQLQPMSRKIRLPRP